MSAINRLREFLAEYEPAFRLWDRAAQTPTGAFVYTLQCWQDFVGDELFAESMLPTSESPDVLFLYRPLKPVFWEAVKKHRLVTLDYLGPASLGLLVRLGQGHRPQGILYDLAAAREAFKTSYRDPVHIGAKRRAREAEDKFRAQVLRREFSHGCPEFAVSVSSTGF